MGILFVLIFYTIALLVAATVGAVVLGIVCYWLTRSAKDGRRRAVVASVLFPFACVAFAGAWFVAYAVINNAVLHRDPGLGDSWETPLPNGYALMMIDTTDQGTVYNPKTQKGRNSVGTQADTAFGVRQLQVSGNHILGALDSGYFDRIGQNSSIVDTYFELDAITGTRTEFKSIDSLRQHATSEGITLKLREFESVFRDYRTTWFDYLSGTILLLVPALAFVALSGWVWSIRRRSRRDSWPLESP